MFIENTTLVVPETGDVREELKNFGEENWRPWHMDKNEDGIVVIWFWRPTEK